MTVAFIGDSCFDKYVYGECKRICPEAPVPVFEPVKTTEAGGMTWNVRANFRAIHQKFSEAELIDFSFTSSSPSVKTRFVDLTSNQMLLRYDEDTCDDELSEEDLRSLDEVIDRSDAVIVSDYNKGLLSPELLERIGDRSKLSFLDTKKTYDAQWGSKFHFIKINEKEFNEGGFPRAHNVIVTLGSRGCQWTDRLVPAPRVEGVQDICGAGDTFLAALAFQFMNSQDLLRSINFAQECCAKVIVERGTSVYS